MNGDISFPGPRRPYNHRQTRMHASTNRLYLSWCERNTISVGQWGLKEHLCKDACQQAHTHSEDQFKANFLGRLYGYGPRLGMEYGVIWRTSLVFFSSSISTSESGCFLLPGLSSGKVNLCTHTHTQQIHMQFQGAHMTSNATYLNGGIATSSD